MEKETNKFHALQLFTDTFTAETVHLTNQAIGIYIRLLSFAWTKNAKPFTTESAYRICQCTDSNCHTNVDDVLKEFFILNFNEETNEELWTHKRLVQEHAYLTEKYKRKSNAGKKGMEIRYSSVNNKTLTPIPIPNPIPNNNIYDQSFEQLWKLLSKKRGSKFKAHEIFIKINGLIGLTIEELAKCYNKQIKSIEDDKFIPHFTTWLSQRRWETEEMPEIPDLIDRLKRLGYLYKGSEGQFELFTKGDKNYRIDKFDEKHQIQLMQ
jgi:uncharacterized protein YdaU (DUF1376 family)